MGFNAVDTLGDDIREDLIENREEVLSFTSLSSDLILLIDGDENLISQPVYDWVANISNHLELDPLVHNSIKLFSGVEHIFQETQKVLNPYMNSVFYALAFANVSTFVLIEGSQFFIDTWVQEYQINETTAIDIATVSSRDYITSKINTLIFGSFLGGFVNQWLDLIYQYFSDKSPSGANFSTMISDIRANTSKWLNPFVDTDIVDYVKYFLLNIDEDTVWDYDFLFAHTSQLLFGFNTAESITFLDELFDKGNIISPIIKSREKLLPFIRGEYIPLGFPPEVREFYVSSFTDGSESSVPTAMILQLSLRSDLNRSEVDHILAFFRTFTRSIDENNPFGYDIIFLSELNYNLERGESISKEFHQVDIIALIIGLLVLLILFRDLKYSIIVMLCSYLTTQVVKAILITIIPPFLNLQETAFSMTTTIILGATLNYSVFFAFRFLEERERGVREAVSKSMSTALHSIHISGLALVITFLPLSQSSITMIRGLAVSTVLGILLSIILLSFLLPTVFLLLGQQIKVKHTVRRRINFQFKKQYIKKILIITAIISILSSVVVIRSGTTVAVEDFIGDSGETGRAMEVFNEKFPENYFSKILVELNVTEKIYFDPGVSTKILNIINNLSNRLNETNHLTHLISISWPLGTPFDYNNNSTAIIPRNSAIVVAEQLINKERNQIFMILQLSHSINSKTALSATTELKDIIHEFVSNNGDKIDSYRTLGALATSENDLQHLITELPVLMVISIILLTLFLFWQLKSISVPLRLELTILLGALMALAIGTLMWQLLTNSPLNLMINLTSIIVLLGLGTDFDIYIYTRIVEVQKEGKNLEDAINISLQRSSTAIIASGSVMAGSFIALFWGDLGLTRQFGLVTFLSIIIDIFLIRTILVPALLLLKNNKSEPQ